MHKKPLLFFATVLSMGVSSCGKPCPKYELENFKSIDNSNQIELDCQDNKKLFLSVVHGGKTDKKSKIEFEGNDKLALIDNSGEKICVVHSDKGKTCGLMYMLGNGGYAGEHDGTSFAVTGAKLNQTKISGFDQ